MATERELELNRRAWTLLQTVSRQKRALRRMKAIGKAQQAELAMLRRRQERREEYGYWREGFEVLRSDENGTLIV